MKKPPVKAVKREQRYLLDYLSTDVDVYDFDGPALINWAREEGRIDEEAVAKAQDEGADYLGTMSQGLREEFAQWIRDVWLPLEMREAPLELPAYTFFERVRALPSGTWCIHFTSADPFERFERGTTLEGLHLSTWKGKKDSAECPGNVTGELGPYEVVYGFAFQADARRVVEIGQDKYGSNAVLFQTDGGVRAYHVGDDEDQVIFPLCSEYNVIPLWRPARDHIHVSTEDGDEVEFSSLKDLIEYVESDEPKGRRLARNGPRLVRGWA